MSKGPLAVRWGAPPRAALQAGTTAIVTRRGRRTPARCRGATGSSSPRTGSTTATTRSSGTGRATRCPPLAPGESASRRGDDPRADPARPLPARVRHGRRAARLVLGARQPDARATTSRSARATGEPNADAARAASSRRPTGRSASRAAHAEGFGVVAGAIEWPGSLLRRPPRELAPYAPGPRPRARLLGAAPLPVGAARASSSSRSARSPGLPAFAAPQRRAVGLRRADRAARPKLSARARPRCGRRRGGRRARRARSASTAATVR